MNTCIYIHCLHSAHLLDLNVCHMCFTSNKRILYQINNIVTMYYSLDSKVQLLSTRIRQLHFQFYKEFLNNRNLRRRTDILLKVLLCICVQDHPFSKIAIFHYKPYHLLHPALLTFKVYMIVFNICSILIEDQLASVTSYRHIEFYTLRDSFREYDTLLLSTHFNIKE